MIMSGQVAVIPLARCEVCQGEGLIRGIFHLMDCAACNGSGLIDRASNEALPAEQMVQQLRVRLNLANKQLAHYKALMPEVGPADDYSRNRNRAGEGGGTWTGD